MSLSSKQNQALEKGLALLGFTTDSAVADFASALADLGSEHYAQNYPDGLDIGNGAQVYEAVMTEIAASTDLHQGIFSFMEDRLTQGDKSFHAEVMLGQEVLTLKGHPPIGGADGGMGTHTNNAMTPYVAELQVQLAAIQAEQVSIAAEAAIREVAPTVEENVQVASLGGDAVHSFAPMPTASEPAMAEELVLTHNPQEGYTERSIFSAELDKVTPVAIKERAYTLATNPDAMLEALTKVQAQIDSGDVSYMPDDETAAVERALYYSGALPHKNLDLRLNEHTQEAINTVRSQLESLAPAAAIANIMAPEAEAEVAAIEETVIAEPEQVVAEAQTSERFTEPRRKPERPVQETPAITAPPADEVSADDTSPKAAPAERAAAHVAPNPSVNTPPNKAEITELQALLVLQGHNPNGIDGITGGGLRTAANAILPEGVAPITGDVSRAQYNAVMGVLSDPAALEAALLPHLRKPEGNDRVAGDKETTQIVQAGLRALGYEDVSFGSTLNDASRAAVADFGTRSTIAAALEGDTLLPEGYVVKRGDSAYKIAGALFGDRQVGEFIIEHNRDIGLHPNLTASTLQRGMVLEIPNNADISQSRTYTTPGTNRTAPLPVNSYPEYVENFRGTGTISAVFYNENSMVVDNDETPYTQTGRGSYYGEKYHGKTKSNGQAYDINAMTIAHPTLPMGTEVEIRNIDTGLSAMATVTDRGPYINVDVRHDDDTRRIADLSPAVAKAISDKGVAGTYNIELTVQNTDGLTLEPMGYGVDQIGLYASPLPVADPRRDVAAHDAAIAYNAQDRLPTIEDAIRPLQKLSMLDAPDAHTQAPASTGHGNDAGATEHTR